MKEANQEKLYCLYTRPKLGKYATNSSCASMVRNQQVYTRTQFKSAPLTKKSGVQFVYILSPITNLK
jgi:hypothetical protein